MSKSIRPLISVAITALFALPLAHSSDDLFDDDDAATATGDVLESSGDLARGLGKNALLRSLSAKEFQKAIDRNLDNREERIEEYYKVRETRNENVRDDRDPAGTAAKIAEQKAPDRLSEQQFDPGTGELFWPKPLDHKVLQPYRKPIEDSLAKRSSPGERYTFGDYMRVQRMVDLLRSSVETMEDSMDAREVVALKDYLSQIAYDARFNASDERVDY